MNRDMVRLKIVFMGKIENVGGGLLDGSFFFGLLGSLMFDVS